MRAIPSTLTSAQQSTSIKALVKLVLTSGSTTYTYTKTRIIDIEEKGDGSLQSIVVILDNSDGSLTDIDFTGYQGVLSYGAITSQGEEYSALAPMWVIPQQFDSAPDKLTCTLTLVGICNLMRDDEANAAYQPDSDDTKSVKTLVDSIIEATIDCFDHCTAYEVVWEAGYDDLADSYKPKDAFRIYVGNNRKSAIDRLLEYTLNVAVPKADGKIHIFKPVTSGSTYDSEYSLERGQHPFFAKALRNRLVTPNYVKVQSKPDDDPQYSGTATHAASYAKLPKAHYVQTRLESNEQATAIAEAIQARAEMWCEAGAASVPLNVGTEAFDYVKVTDEREDDSRAGNIGRFVRHYNVKKNEWRLSFDFGNWQNVRKALDQLGLTTDDLEAYFSRLQVGDLYVENLLADNMDFVWIDPEGNIDLDLIGDTIDNLPDGELYARERRLHLDASGVYVQEETRYTVRMPTEGDNNLWKSDTALTNPEVNDIWLDTNYTPNKVMRWDGDSWEELSEAERLALEKGVIVRRLKGAALTADGLIVLDEVSAGTYGLVLATKISAGSIKLDEVVTGTYGLVKTTDISSGHIKLSTTIEDSTHRTITDSQDGYWDGKAQPDFSNVPVAYKILTTEIDSGHIKLTTATVWSGKVTVRSGVTIDSAAGINLFGQDQALTTRQSESGTIQCKVDSNGAIVAGAGNVILDAGGIELRGLAIMEFRTTGGTLIGDIGAAATHIALMSESGKGITISTTGASSAGAGLAIWAKSTEPMTLTAKIIDMNTAGRLRIPNCASEPSSPELGLLVRNNDSGSSEEGELMFYTNVGSGAQWYRCGLTGVSW